jgi:hypothetical protein
MRRLPAGPCPKVRGLILAGFASALGACAPLPPAQDGLRPWEVAEVARQSERLRRSAQRVDDPALHAWLTGLLERIDPAGASRIEVFVLDLPQPQVDLVGGRLLRVRTGLLRELASEDELVFVLAHELAHRSLGHVVAQQQPGWDPDRGEIDADREARAALGRLGYSPDAGRTLLARLLGGVEARRDRARIEARVAAMAAPPSMPARTPGDTQEDRRFEALLAPYRR